jgi:SsrA-binding protein
MSSKSGGAKKKAGDGSRLVADNRRARYDYAIGDTFEAGIELFGTEVKSLRGGQASLNEAYVQVKEGEALLINCFIPEYQQAASMFNHEPRRPRRLLLHKKEIAKLWNATQRQGMTVVPLKLYFNLRGLAKIEVGLGKGKKATDKRETMKERSWQRDKARLMRDRG